MSETLQDPDLPAGAIVEVFDDGGARRNDGVRLQAANDNPWYVLATIFGEQEEGGPTNLWPFDDELAEQNRRAWNGWVYHNLSKDAQGTFSKDYGFDTAEMYVLKAVSLAEIARIIQVRTGQTELPKINETVDFVNTYFSKPVNFNKYVFAKDSDFRFATFSGDSDFRSATFNKNSYFISATFGGNSNFTSASFNGVSYFGSVTFNGVSGFSTTTFSGESDFSSATFKYKTIFEDAKFETHVPKFHAAGLYDDTTFTLPDNSNKNWPPLSGEGIMPAADQKRAYNRLRLFMNQSQQIDEERFFHRQEMRCKRAMADRLHRPLFTGFEKLSDYGNSIVRPLCWLAGLIIVVALVTGFYLILTGQGNWGTATGWSISNTFPFFGFNRLYFGSAFATNLPWWLKTLGGMQTAFSFILLFLLGLGLRNRFRLR